MQLRHRTTWLQNNVDKKISVFLMQAWVLTTLICVLKLKLYSIIAVLWLDRTLILTGNSKGLLKRTNQLERALTEDQESKTWNTEEIPGCKSRSSKLNEFARGQGHQDALLQEEAILEQAELQVGAHWGLYRVKKRKEIGYLANKFVMNTDIVMRNEAIIKLPMLTTKLWN